MAGEMTPEVLRQLCKEHSGYKTPQLNDKLYANFKGFLRISNLEPYTGLRAIFLEGNALDSLEGLPELPNLKCLFVQNNMLDEISDLENVPALDTLNVSNNQLSRLDNIAVCAGLGTIIASGNKLKDVDGLKELGQCCSLTTVDLQGNKIEDPGIIDILRQIPDLRCLYLKGNPCVSRIPNYRKNVVAALPALTYLDDRPVFENERLAAEAFVAGGLAAERAARQKFREAEDARNKANMEYMQEIRRQGWAARRAREGTEGEGDPYLDDISDEEWVFTEDPPELVEARKALAQYSARHGEMEDPAISAERLALAQQGVEIEAVEYDEAALARDNQHYLNDIVARQAGLAAEASGQLASKAEASGQLASKAEAAPPASGSCPEPSETSHQTTGAVGAATADAESAGPGHTTEEVVADDDMDALD